MPRDDAEKEVRLHNSRAKYLQNCTPGAKDRILEQTEKLLANMHPEPYTEEEIRSTLDLAIHQERLLEWMRDHPRKGMEEKPS